MSPTEVAERHYAQRRRLIRQIEREGVRAWRSVDRDAIAASWAALSTRMLVALIAAQTAAAGQAEGYAAAILAELGIPNEPDGEVVPGAFAGEAADGRSLDRLLLTPVVHARRQLGQGQSITQSMASGQAALRLMLRTEVADASRVADGVAVAARPEIGYVRQVNPPCCPRCAVLAGKWYRYSQGFQRHPGCDCGPHIPAPESMSGDLTTDPRQLFDSSQIRGLSKADTRAIAEGADMNRVINAHRGMYSAGGRKFTHALAGRQGIPSARIRPEQIYRDATSRSDAIRLLRLHGYLR